MTVPLPAPPMPPDLPDITAPAATARRLVKLIRYERVPLALGDPGLNQYKIDYDTGEVWFTSDPNVSFWNYAVPDSGDAAKAIEPPIMVSYEFHTNTEDHIVKADYDTKNLINIALAIRLYDSTSGKPMVVELNDQVQVRNVAR
jgi:hypothetical protein